MIQMPIQGGNDPVSLNQPFARKYAGQTPPKCYVCSLKVAERSGPRGARPRRTPELKRTNRKKKTKSSPAFRIPSHFHRPHTRNDKAKFFFFFFFLQTTNFHFRKIVTPYLCQVCSRIDAESRVTGSSFLLFSGITFFCFFIHDIRGDERDPRKNPLRHLRRPPVRSAQRVTP